MKKKLLLTLLMLSCIITTKAQDTPDENTIKEFEKAIDLQFSKIITGNSFSNFGNYASVASTDESLKASVSFLRKEGDLITIDASGGASEGISAYFNNGELNSNIKVKASYHVTFRPFKSISRNSNELDKLRAEKAKINDDAEAEKFDLKHKKYLIDVKAARYKIKHDSLKIYSSLKKNEDTLEKINIRIENEKEEEKLKQLSNEKKEFLFKKDSLEYERKRIDILSKKSEENMKKLEKDVNYSHTQTLKINTKKEAAEKANKKSMEEVPIEAIDLIWMSFGYGLKKDEFKLFNPTLDYADQIIKKNYTTNEVNLSISRYKWKSYMNDDVYWSLGVTFSYSNNLNDLKKIEIIDTQNIVVSPQRDGLTKQNVFTGTYKEDLNQLMVFFDYYNFFGIGNGKNNQIALHLNPKLVCKDETKPLTSLHAGIMVPFKKTGQESSFVNLEIFYRLNDVFNNAESKNSLLGRNTIGLKAIFPINFLLTKN